MRFPSFGMIFSHVFVSSSAVIKSNFGNVGQEVHVKQTRHLNTGDQVISLYGSWAYFPATVVSFDVDNLMYTINWDDGQQARRVQKYFNVALNKTPDESEIDINIGPLSSSKKYSCCFSTTPRNFFRDDDGPFPY